MDVDDARSLLQRFYYPLTIGTPDGADGFAFCAELIQLGPLTVGHLGFGAPVTFVAAELDAYHVSIPMVGRVHARHAGHEVVARPSTGVVFGPGRPVYTRHDARSVQLEVKIERAALEDELAALLGRPITGTIDLAPAIDFSGGAARSWGRFVRTLSAENENPGSLIWQPLIADQLRRSVFDGLLLSVRHRYSDELHAPATAAPPRAVRLVIDAIQDEPARQFGVTDLARIAGISVRSLQEGFRRHVGCSPMAYLQSARLDRAHEALRREDPTRATVTTVAHDCGFTHLGRFALAYRARFGVTPSQTLRDEATRRDRGGAGAAASR